MRTVCPLFVMGAVVLFTVFPAAAAAGPERAADASPAPALSARAEDPPPAEGEAAAEPELERLRRAARGRSRSGEEVKPDEAAEPGFVSGALGLQALNPEISAVGDYLFTWRAGDQVDARTEHIFRTLGVHLESYLDPYSKFKAALEFTPEEVELGEAYFTRFALLGDLSLTLGKFRQQFGVVNRWHKHGLDQVDFPLPLRQIFGPGGLNQIGASVQWQMPPLIGTTQELTVQITNGENPRLFGQNAAGAPSLLARYQNYQDLSKDLYLEFGWTGLAGRNDTWEVTRSPGETGVEIENLWTTVFGFDLTLLWEPTDRMRYRNWLWRSEVYLASKDILAPDGSGESTLRSWGAYTNFQSKVSRTVDLGARLDLYEPDVLAYAGDPGSPLWPLATSVPDARQWLAAAYLTWSQSPWVRWRVEYDQQANGDLGPDDDTVWLQCIFAAGPHKHERY